MKKTFFLKKLVTSFKRIRKIEEKEEGSQGFTLIDMMVTLGLFALLTTVLIASYPNSIAKVELANAVSDVQGSVRDSQLRATTNDSTEGGNGGLGLYFDPANTTTFFEFKDVSTTTLALTGLLSTGDGAFTSADEISKTVAIPEGFYLRNTCASNVFSRPFSPSSCSRTNSSPGPVSIVYPRGSLQPNITRTTFGVTTKYAAACIELASTRDVSAGNVKNIIISQSGFSTSSLGACDENPVSAAVTVGGGGGEIEGGGVCSPIGQMSCPVTHAPIVNPYPTCGYVCVPTSTMCEPGEVLVEGVCVLDGPTGLMISGDPEVNENTSYALRISRDPAQDLNITYTIDWGDGSGVQTLTDAELVATEACDPKDTGCLDFSATGGTVLHTFLGYLEPLETGVNSTSTITVTATRGGFSVLTKEVLVKEVGDCSAITQVRCSSSYVAEFSPYPVCTSCVLVGQ